jgi:hypothetical protein
MDEGKKAMMRTEKAHLGICFIANSLSRCVCYPNLGIRDILSSGSLIVTFSRHLRFHYGIECVA